MKGAVRDGEDNDDDDDDGDDDDDESALSQPQSIRNACL
jgi:hypothetical protein